MVTLPIAIARIVEAPILTVKDALVVVAGMQMVMNWDVSVMDA
jgi:hypothetical protein